MRSDHSALMKESKEVVMKKITQRFNWGFNLQNLQKAKTS